MGPLQVFQSYLNHKAGMSQINERRVLFNEHKNRSTPANYPHDHKGKY